MRIATKDDLVATSKDIRQEIKNVEPHFDGQVDLLKAEMKSLRTELKTEMTHIKWMVGVGISIGIAILVRLFFFHSPL